MSDTPRTDAAALPPLDICQECGQALEDHAGGDCLRQLQDVVASLTREREAQTAEFVRARAERDALTAALASSEARVREAFMAGYRTWPAVEGNDERAERVLTHWLKPAAALHAPPSGEQAGVTPHTHSFLFDVMADDWVCGCGHRVSNAEIKNGQPPASEASRPTGGCAHRWMPPDASGREICVWCHVAKAGR